MAQSLDALKFMIRHYLLYPLYSVITYLEGRILFKMFHPHKREEFSLIPPQSQLPPHTKIFPGALVLKKQHLGVALWAAAGGDSGEVAHTPFIQWKF